MADEFVTADDLTTEQRVGGSMAVDKLLHDAACLAADERPVGAIVFLFRGDDEGSVRFRLGGLVSPRNLVLAADALLREAAKLQGEIEAREGKTTGELLEDVIVDQAGAPKGAS